MIEDNTALWKLKKVTNFTDTEREIATQAQAEEGVDNTKVMTPLRVKNAIDKQRPFKTYGTIGAFGLTSNATASELAIAMPPLTEYMASIIQLSLPNMALPADGLLQVVKMHNNGAEFKLTAHDGLKTSVYVARWTSLIAENNGFTGWKKLATNGALGMPSDKYIIITAPYTAPTDGWIHLYWYENSNATYLSANIGALRARIPSIGVGIKNGFFAPISKGATFSLLNDITIEELCFIYAQSEV